MKAAVLREVDRPLEVEEVQIDKPGPREVLIRTGATGVCHSETFTLFRAYTQRRCPSFWATKQQVP